MSRFSRERLRQLHRLAHADTVVPVPAGAATLQVRRLAVEREGRPVLADVDLTVRAGELLVLVGPNGAGKSTLLSVLAGDLTPARGTVTLDGLALADFPTPALARRRAVLLQQNLVGFPFSCEEVVRMGRSPWYETDRSDHDDELVAAAMHRTDVTHFAARPFSSLSGGERARVSLARVLAQNTQTVLLDEPTAALDLGHQEAVMQIARTLAREGRAVVVVLHDLGLAAAYADRIAVLAGGTLVGDGAPAEVLDAEQLSAIYQYPIALVDDPIAGLLVVPERGLRGARTTNEEHV